MDLLVRWWRYYWGIESKVIPSNLQNIDLASLEGTLSNLSYTARIVVRNGVAVVTWESAGCLTVLFRLWGGLFFPAGIFAFLWGCIHLHRDSILVGIGGLAFVLLWNRAWVWMFRPTVPRNLNSQAPQARDY